MAIPPRPARGAQRVPARRPMPVRRPVARRSRFGSWSTWLILLVLLVVGYVVYDKTVGVLDDIQVRDVAPTREGGQLAPPLLSAPFNILLIGVDLREASNEDGARSDTLIVVRIDPIAKKAAMLSIPRDTYVELAMPAGWEPESGKINRAYSFGYSNPEMYAGNTDRKLAGATLAQQTVANFLGIEIPYHATVDFKGFKTLIDGLDGITIDVDRAILDAEYPTDDYGYMRLYIPPGLQRMDGETALRYARTRHVDNDFGRGKRQQQVLQAVLQELKGRDILGQIEAAPALLKTLNASVRTTVPIKDIGNLKGLAALAQELSPDSISRYVLEPGAVEGDCFTVAGSDIVWESECVNRVVTEFENGPEVVASEPETAVIQVQNGTNINGLARRATFELTFAKFDTVEPSDAPDSEQTLILDYVGKPNTTRRLAELFNLDPARIVDKSAERDKAPFGADIVLLLGADYKPPQGTP